MDSLTCIYSGGITMICECTVRSLESIQVSCSVVYVVCKSVHVCQSVYVSAEHVVLYRPVILYRHRGSGKQSMRVHV